MFYYYVVLSVEFTVSESSLEFGDTASGTGTCGSCRTRMQCWACIC